MSTPQLRSDFRTRKPYKYYKFKRVWESDRAVPATQNGRVNPIRCRPQVSCWNRVRSVNFRVLEVCAQGFVLHTHTTRAELPACGCPIKRDGFGFGTPPGIVRCLSGKLRKFQRS